MSDVKTLAMFPGQGSQYVGMGKILLDEFPYTAKIFEEAEDAAKISIRRLCLEGPDEQLKLTAHTQPTIVTVSVATWHVLGQEKGFKAHIFSGHSLGEYSALVAANRLKFARAIELVRARGLAMQRAVPEGAGAMSAVLSCEAGKLEAFCKDASNPEHTVEVVNYNSPQQLVVAGSASAVAKLEESLKAASVKFIRLPVSAPFHSRMMAPARAEMTPLLNETSFVQNATPVIPNYSAELVTAYGADYLIQQIDSPVKWIQTIEKASSAGVNHFVEVGPGKVLAGLAKRILPKGEWRIEGTDDISAYLKS